MAEKPSMLRRLLLIPPIIVGIGIFAWSTASRQPPALAQAEEQARSVRFIEASPLQLVPVAEGFGSVQPAQVWSAVAEVSGRLVELHDKLANGAVFPAGTLLARIDPVDYELAIAQVQAQLAELEVQAGNSQASLDIELRSLALAQREFRRINDLVGKGTISQSDADTAERALLAARTSVQNLRNALALVPAQRRSLEAQLAQSRRDLDQTYLRAPFNLRIAALAVERDQYVGTGQKLFEGDSIDRVEVVGQFAMEQVRNLLEPTPGAVMDVATLGGNLAELTGFESTLVLDLGASEVRWDAEFVRISDTVDPHTRTVGIVVAVDRPFEQAVPGVRPPLTKGMFVRVLLSGRAQAKRILVPRSSVRDGQIYLADADNRLRRRAVTTAFAQGDFSVIADGVDPGERVVVSDLVPAVEGMLLAPQQDQSLQQAIRRAAGDGS